MPLKLLQLVPKVPVKVRAAQSKFCDNSASPQDAGEDETQTGVHGTRCEPRRRRSIAVMESTSAVTLLSRPVFHHVPGNVPADWTTGSRCSYSQRARRQSVGGFPSEDMKLLPEQSFPRPARRQSVGSCSGESRKLTGEDFPFSLRPQLLDFGPTSRAGLGTTITRRRPSLGENTAALWRSESRDDNGSEVPLIQQSDRRRSLVDSGDFGLTTFEAQPTLDALLRQELFMRKDSVAAAETSRPHQPQRRHSCHGNFASMSRDAASSQMIPLESTDPDASDVTVDVLQTGNMSRVTITSSIDQSSTDQDACSSRRHRSWRKSAHALIFISRLSRPGSSRLTPINEAPCEATVTTTGPRDDDISTNSAAAAAAAAGNDDDDDATTTTTTTTTTSLQRYADETENGNGNDPEARNGEAGATGGEVEDTNDASDSNGNTKSGGGNQENGEGLEESGGAGGIDGDGEGRDGEEEDPGRNEAAGISNLRLAANGNRIPSLRTLCLQTTFSGFREVRSEDDQSTLSRQTLSSQQFFYDGTNVVCAYCNNAALNDGFVDLSHSHRLLTGDALNSVINPQLRARFQQLSSWMGVQPRYYDNVNIETLGVHRRNL